INVDLKLEVWDSPNSAGVVIDAIRCMRLALDAGVGGALLGPSAYFMKSPPVQYSDDVARQMVEEYIRSVGLPAVDGDLTLQLDVTDIGEARGELTGRGMEVSEVDAQPWGLFVYFSDPDGNAWSVQQLPPRHS